MMSRSLAIAVALLFAALAAASAQEQPPAAADPRACAPGERLLPGERSPQAPPGTTGQTLSERLGRTDGVLCPPNVDPDMTVPAPDTGKTPVIPPPGSPGGDPNVRPK
jgi:hypothetical protein